MPIEKQGLEILIERLAEQTGMVGASPRRRTIGRYAVYIDGVELAGLSGTIAEQKGPSDSTKTGNDFDRRIAPGRYPLFTQDGTKYKTIGYRDTAAARKDFVHKPRPGIELMETGDRTEILIHPASGFLSSEGCIHPSGPLPDGSARIDHEHESRPRVVALIEAMKGYCGAAFPAANGQRIPDCWCVIDDLL
jgi:hypothetical protein